MKTVPEAITLPPGVSDGSLQVVAASPIRAAALPLMETVAEPFCTVPLSAGDFWNGPAVGMCAGEFVAVDNVFEPNVLAQLPADWLSRGTLRTNRTVPFDASNGAARDDPAAMDAITTWPGTQEAERDPEMINEVLDVMTGLAKEGMTMVVVTHEMGFARRAANRVVFMSEGQIVEENTPQEFFTNPRSSRAKDFLSKILTH